METRAMAKRRKMVESEAAQFTGPNIINYMPTECLLHIFSFLPIEDKLTLTSVCRRWRYMEHEIWRKVKRLDLSGAQRWKLKYKRLMAVCGRHLQELTISVSRRSKIIRIVTKHCRKLLKLKIIFNYFPGTDAHCLDVANLFIENHVLEDLNMEHRLVNPESFSRCHILFTRNNNPPKLWIIQVDRDGIRMAFYRYIGFDTDSNNESE